MWIVSAEWSLSVRVVCGGGVGVGVGVGGVGVGVVVVVGGGGGGGGPEDGEDSLVQLELASHGGGECAAPVVASRWWGVDRVLLGNVFTPGSWRAKISPED